jgi:peroxiredoxin
MLLRVSAARIFVPNKPHPYTIMAIPVGTTAPDFTVTTLGTNGPELFTLSEHIGPSNILLLFVPMAFTGVCTKEFCEISSGINEYTALNAKVVGISGDNPFAQKAWAEKEGITLQLLSDYDHKITTAYDVAYDAFLPAKNLIMGGVPKRSAFIIDKAGVIQYSEALESPGDLPDFTAIKAKLAELA